MRILYGIQSQGQGHFNRAAVVIRALRARGHHVDVLTSGHPEPPYAAALLGPSRHIAAPIFELAGGRLKIRASLAGLARAIPTLLGAAKELEPALARDRVDLVLTDFEPVTAWAARRAGVPFVGVAGQYRMTHTDAPHPGSMFDRELARAVISACTPRMTRTMVVSFAPHRPTRPHTDVIGPIVGDDIRAATPTAGDRILVYTYARAPEDVIAQLPAPHRYRVYGLGGPERRGHVELCPTDRATFVADLASCRAVVGNGSFQLASEAAVLGKPILAIPFAGQYEERFSAHQVARAGLGVHAPKLAPSAIAAVLACAPPARLAGDGVATLVDRLAL